MDGQTDEPSYRDARTHLKTMYPGTDESRFFPFTVASTQVDPLLEEQFQTGRILAAISSRPGQVGRADGYILEGKELEFYIRKLKAKKGK